VFHKQGDKYSVPADVAELLSERSADNVLPMLRHISNCLGRWAALPNVVKTGKCAETAPSIRGAEADRESFIGGMNTISRPIAAGIMDKIKPTSFRHMLDVGGGPGTWSIAFLRAAPQARVTLFDLPEVVPIAEFQFEKVGLTDRVSLVEGDYYTDALPEGEDLAWLGAICHQNSRQQNRELFKKVHRALADGGTAIIRDVVMDPSRTAIIRDVVMDPSRTTPAGGALFAINMLVGTEAGGTYTFDEYSEDLCAAGFTDVELLYQDEFMSSLIQASKA